jgi:hypothetical protein
MIKLKTTTEELRGGVGIHNAHDFPLRCAIDACVAHAYQKGISKVRNAPSVHLLFSLLDKEVTEILEQEFGVKQ